MTTHNLVLFFLFLSGLGIILALLCLIDSALETFTAWLAKDERPLPPPDTIAYRNARSVAEWTRKKREMNAGRRFND
jgi:hypothetical protein